MTQVSVVKCEDYDNRLLKERIIRSLEPLGGLSLFAKPGDRVLLKPNLLSGKPAAACVTTNPSFVATVASLLLDYGCTPVVGDSPPILSGHKVASKSGLTDELNRIGVKLIDFKTPTKLTVREGSTFKDIFVAQEVLDADCVINLPKVKTHTHMVLTACVKNMFGAVIGKDKSRWHLKAGVSNECFAQMLIDLYLGLSPELTIADMIMTMEGNGPSSGTPKYVGAIVAGSDCIAMDSVICDILKIPTGAVYTLKEARKLDGGTHTDISSIEVICDSMDEIRKNAAGFKLARKTNADFGLKPFLNKLLRDTLTGKPVIDKKRCTYCKSCEDICPADIMKISKEEIIIDYEKCIKCFCCQEICPNSAVSVKQGILLKLFG